MKDKNYKTNEDPKPPSMWQMAKNFSSSLAEYLKAGAPNVTTDQYLERLDACNNCPKLMREKMRCGLCGCLLEHKAKWKTTTCPDDPSRWPALMDAGDVPPNTGGDPKGDIPGNVWDTFKK